MVPGPEPSRLVFHTPVVETGCLTLVFSISMLFGRKCEELEEGRRAKRKVEIVESGRKIEWK